MGNTMRRFARWHIWLGWLTGVPILLWTVSGLVMVARPIEEVRGEHLRRDLVSEQLPPGRPAAIEIEPDAVPGVTEIRTAMLNGRAITMVTRADGSISRHDALTAETLPPLSDVEARLLVAKRIVGGDHVLSVRLTSADDPPLDFRRPVEAWQVTLADGTRVYVARDSGEIAAVRTRWWRVFDVMWGLHIMDLQTREDTHHPILIFFAALAVIGSLLGLTLLFRRRRTPATRKGGEANAGASVGGAPGGLRSPPPRGLTDET